MCNIGMQLGRLSLESSRKGNVFPESVFYFSLMPLVCCNDTDLSHGTENEFTCVAWTASSLFIILLSAPIMLVNAGFPPVLMSLFGSALR